MKVAVLSPYPTSQFQKELGLATRSDFNNATWTVTLVRHLAKMPDTEIHLVTEIDGLPRSQVIQADGVTFHFVKAPAKFKTLTLWQFDRRRVNQVVEAIRPDLVHGQGIETQYGYIALSSRYPCLITIHGLARLSNRVTNVRLFSRPKLVEFFEAYCLRKARNFVIINPFIAEYLGLSETRYRLFPIANAVAEHFFEPVVEPRESNLLLAVGYVDRLKAHDVLLQAMARLRQRGLDCKAVIVGPCSDRNQFDRLQQLIREQKLEVEFTGFLAPHEVLQLLRRCTILVHPSRHDNAPMSVCEAMASGTPVIAARVGGVPHLIHDGETGLLFESENVMELADQLQLLLEDATKRMRLSEQARLEARKLFHPQQVARLTHAAYQEVLSAN